MVSGKGRAILGVVPDDAEGVSTEWICRRLSAQPQDLGDAFESLKAGGALLGFAGLWMKPAGYQVGTAAFLAALDEIHKESPERMLIDPVTVASRAGLKWKGKPLARAADRMAQDGVLAAFPEGVRSVEFRPTLPARQRQLLDRVVAEIEKEEINAPNAFEVSKALSIPMHAVEEIIRIGVLCGEIVQIAETVFYTPRQLQALRTRIGDSGPLTASAVRDSLGTTRKYAVALLSYLRPR